MPKEEKLRLFLFSIISLGESKITHANLQFEVADVDVRDIIGSTDVFKDVKMNKYGEAWVTTEATQSGNSHALIPLSNKGELIIDAIPARGGPATEFDLPKAVKSTLSIFMIVDSYRNFAARWKLLRNGPWLAAILIDYERYKMITDTTTGAKCLT